MATDISAIVHDLRESDPIPEDSTFHLSFQVQDPDGSAIAASSLDSCELTLLYNDRDGTTINSRSAVSILNENGGSIDENGNGTWEGTPDDAPIVDSRLPEEDHSALITWKWTPGSVEKTGRALVRHRVYNLEKVSS